MPVVPPAAVCHLLPLLYKSGLSPHCPPLSHALVFRPSHTATWIVFADGVHPVCRWRSNNVVRIRGLDDAILLQTGWNGQIEMMLAEATRSQTLAENKPKSFVGVWKPSLLYWDGNGTWPHLFLCQDTEACGRTGTGWLIGTAPSCRDETGGTGFVATAVAHGGQSRAL